MQLRTAPGPNGVTVVHATGQIDRPAASELREALQNALASGKHRLVVDLEGARFVQGDGGSELMSGLIRAAQAAQRAGGGLRIVAAGSDEARTLFQRLRLDKVASIHDSVEQAAASF